MTLDWNRSDRWPTTPLVLSVALGPASGTRSMRTDGRPASSRAESRDAWLSPRRIVGRAGHLQRPLGLPGVPERVRSEGGAFPGHRPPLPVAPWRRARQIA